MLLLSKFFCKILSNITTFYNHAKLSKEPQLNCCRVNSTIEPAKSSFIAIDNNPDLRLTTSLLQNYFPKSSYKIKTDQQASFAGIQYITTIRV